MEPITAATIGAGVMTLVDQSPAAHKRLLAERDTFIEEGRSSFPLRLQDVLISATGAMAAIRDRLPVFNNDPLSKYDAEKQQIEPTSTKFDLRKTLLYGVNTVIWGGVTGAAFATGAAPLALASGALTAKFYAEPVISKGVLGFSRRLSAARAASQVRYLKAAENRAARAAEAANTNSSSTEAIAPSTPTTEPTTAPIAEELQPGIQEQMRIALNSHNVLQRNIAASNLPDRSKQELSAILAAMFGSRQVVVDQEDDHVEPEDDHRQNDNRGRNNDRRNNNPRGRRQANQN